MAKEASASGSKVLCAGTSSRRDDPPSFNSEVFDQAADAVYKNGSFDYSLIADPAVRNVIRETFSTLDTAISSSLPEDCPDTLRYALEENAFIFSGFKTFHAMREIGLSMVTDNGTIKPYEDFKKDVQKINATYNTNYLHAEYYHALGSAQMAEKWLQIEKDGDRYDLQYRTAQDDHVREDHVLLDGITLPVSDPFWEKYFPPNGWGCRCTAVQVRKGKYPHTDSTLAMQRGDNATQMEKQKIFRFNPGKELKLFPPKHPYYKAPEEAKEIINEAGQEYILHRENYKKFKADSNYKDVGFYPLTGGLKASHINHNFDKKGGKYELHVQNAGVKCGYEVILENEWGGKFRGFGPLATAKSVR